MGVFICTVACVHWVSSICFGDCFLFLSHFLSTTVPPDLPHQRIIWKPRSSVIRRRPLMCPWAFSTQPKSHRRTHTDNSAARHGFWKVTLRIASNTFKKNNNKTPQKQTKREKNAHIQLGAHTKMCMQGNGHKKHAIIHGQRRRPKHSYCQTHKYVPLAEAQRVHLCSAKRTGN